MPYIMNASSQEHQVRVHGSWFTFKPDQIKEMQEEKVLFLVSTCGYLGFVSLPDEISDLDFKSSEEGKKVIADAKATGVARRIQFLEELKNNELNALQQDYDRKNDKSDPRVNINDHMLEQFKELASYKTKNKDEAQKKIDQVKELEKLFEE